MTQILVHKTDQWVESALMDGEKEVGHFVIHFGTTFSLNKSTKEKGTPCN